MQTKTEFKNRSWKQFKNFSAVQSGVVLLCLMASLASAQTYSILHTFGTNLMGLNPSAPLVEGPDGVLYGTTECGGIFDRGQVFKVNADGTGYTGLKDFSGPDGANPAVALILSGATLYGTTANGGTNNGGNGTVFKLKTDGSGFTVLKYFNGEDGDWPQASLVLSGTTIYGTTYSGGSFQRGTFFRMDADGTGFVKLLDFTPTNEFPGGLLLTGTTFYGTTYSGGAQGMGTVFKVNTDGGGYAQLKEFTGDDGVEPLPGLVLGETILYGTTAGGTVFCIKTNGSDFTVLKHFTNSVEGDSPNGGLLLSGSTLYGTTGTTRYGHYGNSTVFRLNTNGSDFVILCKFTNSNDGFEPRAGLLLSGTTLFGTTYYGGAYGNGTVFRLRTDGSDCVPIVQFMGGDGTEPGDIVLSGATFYGVTGGGGGSGNGTVFKLNTDGSGYAVLKDFTNGLDGANPYCGLLVDDSTIYGSASYGGISWNGTLFKLNTDGSGYAVLKDFDSGLDGRNPSGELVLIGATLYGTTGGGGAGDYGTVFRINTDGTGYTLLKQFAGDDGRQPGAGLVVSGSMLYGTTIWGGKNDCGTVFALNTNGDDFTVLKHFDGSDGCYPGSLLLSGSTLYGAAGGGGSGYDTVFKINTDGSDFAAFGPFDWNPELVTPPKGKLCLAGSALYGGCIDGVFQINTDGTEFALLKKLVDRDGYYPHAGVVLSGSTLFGTASYGGILDGGVVFGLSLLPGVVEIPQGRTVEAGGSISFAMEPTGARPFGYQWLCNGKNVFGDFTTNLLCFSDLTIAQSGAYTLVVTNAFGSFTSVPVMLSVIPVVERRLVPGIKVTGQVGDSWNVEYADFLCSTANWEPLATVTLSSASRYCFDASLPLPSMRFYRFSKATEPEEVPALNLNFYPALTVTGAIGSSVRVDNINPVGPTDAWVALGTMTLTNKSQLYFDVSAPGQPTRLYRIVPVP